MEARIGPFLHVENQQRVTQGDRELLVLTYRARSAGGLIGYECNGVAIVQTKPQPAILVEGLAQGGSGYFGHSAEQLELFKYLSRKTFDGLAAEVNARGDLPWTYGVNDPWVKVRADGKMTAGILADAKFAQENCPGYDAKSKERWKRCGGRFMRRLAKDLGSKATPSFNAGGIAVSGDWSLSAVDVGVYVHINADGHIRGYWRQCTAEDKYGCRSWNRNWDIPSDLEGYRRLVATMKKEASVGQAPHQA